jgi:hypothetical protein
MLTGNVLNISGPSDLNEMWREKDKAATVIDHGGP